jgi:excisionase family DNA binding protein
MNRVQERPTLPSTDDAQLAAQASRQLSRANRDNLRVQIDGGETLRLPQSAATLLYHLLTEMAQGNAVTIIPVHAELSTQEAADYMNVSRPYLIKLLQSGALPFHMVGSHRRVKFTDLENYRKIREAEQRRMREELTAEAQAMGLGY